MKGATGRKWLVDFVLPGGCVVCRSWIPASTSEPGPEPALVCGTCRTRLTTASWPRCRRCHHPRGTGRAPAEGCLACREWPTELGWARHAYVLEPPASDLVHAIKYEGWRELAPLMSRAMVRALVQTGPARPRGAPVAVVPVPTTSARRRSRGYNQAELLARGVAAELGLPLVEALVRGAGASSQTALSPAERLDNVRGAFGPSPTAGRVAKLDVVLVDDVLTTGATAGEAARALVRAGAASVGLVSFARAFPRLSARAA